MRVPREQYVGGGGGGGHVLVVSLAQHIAPDAPQPGLEVAEADIDVHAQARLGDRAGGTGQQVGRRDVDVLAPPVDLVGPGHPLVEDLHGDRDQRGVGHPGAVVAVAGLAHLVGADLARGPAALASGSFLIGIWAAMPPMAWHRGGGRS